MSNNLILERFAWCPEGTYGVLKFPDGTEFFTCEKPWRNNEAYKSCIPVGVYYLEQRHSPVVRRTSGGQYAEGWEVTNVPGRSYIMIHVGNWPSDVEGCIAVGKGFGIIQNKQGQWSNAVLDSRTAFKEMMEKMDEFNTWVLDIRTYFPRWF